MDNDAVRQQLKIRHHGLGAGIGRHKHRPAFEHFIGASLGEPVTMRFRRFAPIGRNFDTDLPVEHVPDLNQRVFEEDKAIVEAQMPECLPLGPMPEAHIPADRGSMAYRRGPRTWGRAGSSSPDGNHGRAADRKIGRV